MPVISSDQMETPLEGVHETSSRRSVHSDGHSNSASPTGQNLTQRRPHRQEASSLHGPSHGKKKATQEPNAGRQAPVKNVFDILNQARIIVGMVQNVWGWTNSTDTHYRLCLPGLCRVHVGPDTYVLHGYLLQDLALARSSKSTRTHTGVTDPTPQDVYVRHHTTYFPNIILLLKLRWLLRLHSACCELDYKMCSLKNLIVGIQYVVLQEHAEAEADSGFDNKVVQHVGSHINLESVLDDFTDQLQKALGKSWHPFLEFVSTCDPSQSAFSTTMDATIKKNKDRKPHVVSNEYLANVIDTIFIADFLRQPRSLVSGRLRQLYEDLEMLGLQPPELPPLKGAANLRAWALAKTKPTRKDREKGGGKQVEKLAQVDFVALTCALELHEPEIMATAQELAEAAQSVPPPDQLRGEVMPQITDLGVGEKPGSAGPPAARVIAEEKPRLTGDIFDALVAALHHHMTFPEGIRERLFTMLCEEYGLSQEQGERVGIATAQNIDGNRIPEYTLLKMDDREKVRIRKYESYTNKDCSHLLVPALVPTFDQKNKPAKHTYPAPVLPRVGLPGSVFGSVDMTRSLPDLRGFQAKRGMGRTEFKVPLSTGPLTMDPDLHKLRTTGFFIRMPPLKNS